MRKAISFIIGTSGTAAGLGFLMEPLFHLGDWRWIFVIIASWIPAAIVWRHEIGNGIRILLITPRAEKRNEAAKWAAEFILLWRGIMSVLSDRGFWVLMAFLFFLCFLCWLLIRFVVLPLIMGGF